MSSRSSPLENDPNSHALSTGCVARYCCIFGMMSVCVLMFIISSLFVYAAKISMFRETAKQDCPFYDKLISDGVIADIMPKAERLTQEERKRRAEEALRKWG